MTTAELRARAKQSDWLEWAGRAGLATRGLLYLTVGMLAAQIALGDTGQKASRDGALRAVAHQPMGRLLLALVAVGMAGYALWQLVLAVADPGHKGDDASGLATRAGYVGRAVIYMAGVATALPLTFGSNQGSGDSKEQDWTARAFELPAGRWLVAAVGAAIIAAGLWNGWKGLSGKWRKKLDTSEMSKNEERWAEPIAIGGFLGRMLVFGLVGGFLMRAAVRFDPNKGVGLDAALKNVLEKSYGPWAIAVFATALTLFGLFSLLQARWRRVNG